MKSTLTQKIHTRSNELGFELVGISPAKDSETIDLYRKWLENGYAGKMEYLKRHLPLKENPRTLLKETKSVISLAMNYYSVDPPTDLSEDPSHGQISRYAWGDDYHDVIRDKLQQLVDYIKTTAESELQSRVFVDSGPILEREYAQNSGLGWIGKNTNLINWQTGSWYFLSEILISLELEYNTEPARGSCGTCTKCIEACPTDAILEPNVLDSRLCISYLTIELKDSIPKELRPQIGNLIFGCDICQEVCPWNSKAVPTSEPAFHPRKDNLVPELLTLMGITHSDFSKKYKGSPIKRTKWKGFLRNVIVAIGNWGSPTAVPALKKAIINDEPMIRGHAAWALGQIGGKNATKALENQLENEIVPEVITEIQDALHFISN
ncbi:tRNA epoxyqueuosine(34) reductase QueG [Candidatus Poribacteria bacterium]|nr:tRNA epoxyqueuosine(34) reductase QueG [Candidatus Poribacteria bacterium]